MVLMIDWGNTFLKFIILETLSLDCLKTKRPTTIEKIAELSSKLSGCYERVLIASVRSDSDNNSLTELLKPYCQQLYYAKTAPFACGVSCAYSQPDYLGVDRWLAILAAETLSSNVATISIGSAITLDVVINKKHLGGHILPGKRLMRNSLFQTGQVRPDIDSKSQTQLQLGQSTSECVNLAIDAAIKGYLQTTIQAIEKKHLTNTWLITGGGGEFWKTVIELPERNTIYRPLLVFEGLMRWYLEQN